MSKGQAPLFQALLRHAHQNYARFHVPGHKGGRFFSPEGLEVFRSILSLDLTELPGLDYLHAPQGVIKEAQELAARQFGADKTYFLVNGSTVGNLAMVLATVGRGDVVLVQRNSHQSVFHALSLAEVQAVPLAPQVDPDFQIAGSLDPDHFQEALNRFPQAKACLFTYPNYYGLAEADKLRTMIDLAHERGLVVLVDEAHGAHFGQHAQLPPSAMQLGADVSVQSTHKMLGSMTMTAMLHMRLDRVVADDVEMYLGILQSSSPSYPLMASLDLARENLSRMTEEDWRESLKACRRLREKLSLMEGAYLFSQGKAPKEDPFKLIIRPRLGMGGFELQQALRQEGIEVELADPQQVCLTLPLVPCPDWEEKLLSALRKIGRDHCGQRLGAFKEERLLYPAERWRTVRPISLKVYGRQQKRRLPLEESVGRRAGALITPYPPGIPLLIPGEMITEEDVALIRSFQRGGALVHGMLDDGTVPVLKD